MSLIIGLGRTILFKKTANQVSQQNDIVICTCNMNCLVNDLQNCDTQSFHYFLELFDMSVFSPTVCKNFIILFFITHSLHFFKKYCVIVILLYWREIALHLVFLTFSYSPPGEPVWYSTQLEPGWKRLPWFTLLREVWQSHGASDDKVRNCHQIYKWRIIPYL